MTPLDKLNTVIRLVGPGVTVGGDKGDLNDLSTYEWAEGITPPTEEEIEAEFKAQEYSRNRKVEYDALNQFELMSDDDVNGTTTHRDAIAAIKKKWPKNNSGPVE